MREGESEVLMAEDYDFNDLIDIQDIRGMTHCHSTFSDGRHTIEQMALAAQNMGMEYITLTDHSPTAHYAGGLEIDRLKEQWEEIDRVQELVKIKILKGTECVILISKSGDIHWGDWCCAEIRYRAMFRNCSRRLLKRVWR